MDPRSENVLSNVAPDLADKVRAAAAKLAEDGTFFLVVSGLRTADQQNALFAQGRTAPGHIVTRARAGFSMHNYGLAVDAAPFLSGGAGALNWHAETPQFRAMVAALESQGLIWGGDWKNFPDDDHFQMPDLPDTPNALMRADYGDGSEVVLSTIWEKADSGAYLA